MVFCGLTFKLPSKVACGPVGHCSLEESCLVHRLEHEPISLNTCNICEAQMIISTDAGRAVWASSRYPSDPGADRIARRRGCPIGARGGARTWPECGADV